MSEHETVDSPHGEMGPTYPLAELPAGMLNMVVASKFHSALTGVRHATQASDGTVTLTYTDNSRESAVLPYDITDKILFQIIDDTQTAARAAIAKAKG